jgi:ribosomal protein S2
MKNVQKHFQDFFAHSNLKDTSTSLPFNFFPHLKKMQKCFERIVTRNIPNCLVIINANKNSMTILEADQLQIPIISWMNSNILNKLQKLITYPIPINDDSIQFVYLFCNLIMKKIIISQSV